MVPALSSGLPYLSNGRMMVSWPGSGKDEGGDTSRRSGGQLESWVGVPMNVI